MEASSIASLHEHGVDLRLDAAAARELPPPEHRAPVFTRGSRRSWAGGTTGSTSSPAGGTTGNARAEHGRPRDGRGGVRGADRGRGAGAALAAGGALLPRPSRAPRGGLLAADALPARPRPDRARQGVPAPDAQDPGVRGAPGRSLPHAPHPHAGGDHDLEDGGAGAAPERGPRGGDRAGPRPRPPPVRAHRRGGARRVPERALRARLPPLRALAAGGRAPRARRAGAQPDRAGARRDRRALLEGAAAADAGGPDRARDRPGRLHQPRHRRRRPGGAARRAGAAERADRGARPHRVGADRRARPRHGRALGGAGGRSCRGRSRGRR